MLVECREEASKNQPGVRPLIKASSDASICTARKVDYPDLSSIVIQMNSGHLYNIQTISKTFSELLHVSPCVKSLNLPVSE